MLRVLAPFVLAIAAMALLGIAGFGVLSGLRAYASGESQWSKARGRAVASLRAYAAGDAAAALHFAAFDQALSVPMGDRQARLAMDRDPPDVAAAREGFRAGLNAARDTDGMIALYLQFRGVDELQAAIAAWRDGDAAIAELQDFGNALRDRLARGEAMLPPAELEARLVALERRLLAAEQRFLDALGAASARVERLLLALMLLVAGVLALGGALYVRAAMRRQFADQRLLADVNRRWELAAEAAGIGVFDWHRDSDRFVLDDRARALYELPDDGHPVDREVARRRVHPDDRDGVQAAWDAALASRTMLRQRVRLVLPSGALRHVEVVGQVHDDARGGVHLVGIVRDVADELARAQLAVAKEAAEHAARARAAFLSRLSHELRTPLNAVLGLAQLLRMDRGEPLTPGQDRRVAVMVDSGEQLLRLVDDVLDITRIDSGQVDLEIGPVDLHELLRSSLNLVEPERARFEIRVVDELPAQLPAVAADMHRLRQVLVNLLSNGCKYNRRGGRLFVAACEEGGMIRLEVRDEGAGIPPAQLAELFQPFRRLPGSQAVPGTGLGLVVVKSLVEQMGGAVRVDSSPGEGSRFSVRLPKAAAVDWQI